MPGGALAHLWCSLAVNDPTNDPWTVIYKVLGTNGGLSYSWNEAQFDDKAARSRMHGAALGYEDGFRGEIPTFSSIMPLAMAKNRCQRSMIPSPRCKSCEPPKNRLKPVGGKTQAACSRPPVSQVNTMNLYLPLVCLRRRRWRLSFLDLIHPSFPA